MWYWYFKIFIGPSQLCYFFFSSLSGMFTFFYRLRTGAQPLWVGNSTDSSQVEEEAFFDCSEVSSIIYSSLCFKPFCNIIRIPTKTPNQTSALRHQVHCLKVLSLPTTHLSRPGTHLALRILLNQIFWMILKMMVRETRWPHAVLFWVAHPWQLTPRHASLS